MIKKQRKSSKNSKLLLDISSNECVEVNGSILNKLTSVSNSKDQLVISALGIKYFITSYISISKNIPDIYLYDAIYSKTYDELGLDQAISYKIEFIELFGKFDSDNRIFYVFVIDPQTLKETIAPALLNVKYIDILLPQPLLYRSLYDLGIITTRGVECFIYFAQKEASISMYNESELVYTKSIEFSLEEMHNKFCEISGEAMPYVEFIDFLKTQNLKTTSSEHKITLLRTYKEMFASINDILSYAKRALELEKINHIYIDSQVAFASKLHEIAEMELGIKSSPFNFNYGLVFSDASITHTHALLQLFSMQGESNRYNLNFTIFNRPPKFSKRDSGKAIILVAASLVVALLYPAIYFALDYAQSLMHTKLTKEYRDIHTQKVAIEDMVKERSQQLQLAQEQLLAQKHEYKQKQETLLKIKEVKVNYPSKSTLLSQLSDDLNKFDIKLESIGYAEETKDNKSNKDLTLGLTSNSDKKITSLIEYLTKRYEKRFDIVTEAIYFDSESKLYFSQLKVSLI